MKCFSGLGEAKKMCRTRPANVGTLVLYLYQKKQYCDWSRLRFPHCKGSQPAPPGHAASRYDSYEYELVPPKIASV